MGTTITATELAKNLSDVLNRVRHRGERFLIERNGEPLATLTPASTTATITMRELAAQLGDLALPGEWFADDLEAIQRAQPPAGDPTWRS